MLAIAVLTAGSGCRRRPSGRKATSLAALSRAVSGPRAVREPVHALSLQAREPGGPAVARLTITPRRATAGPPGSRAWRLNACTGSLTARGPLTARDNAASDVAFRPLGRRRHPEPMISRLNNPAYVSLCQRFACVLTGADA